MSFTPPQTTVILQVVSDVWHYGSKALTKDHLHYYKTGRHAAIFVAALTTGPKVKFAQFA